MKLQLNSAYWQDKITLLDGGKKASIQGVNFSNFAVHEVSNKQIVLSNVSTADIEVVEMVYPGLPQATIKSHGSKSYAFNDPMWRE